MDRNATNSDFNSVVFEQEETEEAEWLDVHWPYRNNGNHRIFPLQYYNKPSSVVSPTFACARMAQKLAAYSTILLGLVLVIDDGFGPVALVGIAITAMGFGVWSGNAAAGKTAVAVLVLFVSINVLAILADFYLRYGRDRGLDTSALGDAAEIVDPTWFLRMAIASSVWMLANIALLITWLRQQAATSSQKE